MNHILIGYITSLKHARKIITILLVSIKTEFKFVWIIEHFTNKSFFREIGSFLKTKLGKICDMHASYCGY